MGEEKRPEGSAGHKIVEGANFAVYTLVVIAIVALANWFVERNDKTWDLTPNKVYSLSPQTLKLLKGLNRDVTLYVFDRKEAFAVVERLQKGGANIQPCAICNP